MDNSDTQPTRRPRTQHTERSWLIGGALICLLLGAVIGWSVHLTWQLGGIRVTNSFKSQMMHRKTRSMDNILDGLVLGDLNYVEKSAQQMWDIGHSLNWYMSSRLYENNDQIFRDSTAGLIEAARERNYDAAKESALLLERSCIECHALINREKSSIPELPPGKFANPDDSPESDNSPELDNSP
jgi:hypothetical protein